MRRRDIAIKGRHDPIIVPRAGVVVEAMAALTTADFTPSVHDPPDWTGFRDFSAKHGASYKSYIYKTGEKKMKIAIEMTIQPL